MHRAPFQAAYGEYCISTRIEPGLKRRTGGEDRDSVH